MGLDIEQMDAEPAAEPVEPVVPTEPAAQPSPPIDATAAAAPAAPAVEPVIEPPKTVPLATLLAERREWQEKLTAAKAVAPAEAPKPPVDFMEDPKGYVDQRIETATSKAAANEAELQSFREQQQITALINEAGVAEAAFAKDHSDYEAALAHVRDTRMAQLRLMDTEAPEAELRQVIAREEIMGIASAKQRGINPAELAYKYAQTLGYRTPAPATPAPAPVAAVPAAAVAPATLAHAADVSAARSLGAGGGGGDSVGDDEESELTSALKARFRR